MIWPSPWNFVKVLFLLNRYFPVDVIGSFLCELDGSHTTTPLALTMLSPDLNVANPNVSDP
jgi:hypothetical protein